MATRVIAGKEVQVNDEGFMTDPSEWNKDIATAIAAEEGIPELTADHWKVIDWVAAGRPSTASPRRSGRSRPAPTSTPSNSSRCSRRDRPRRSPASRGLGKPEGCV